MASLRRKDTEIQARWGSMRRNCWRIYGEAPEVVIPRLLDQGASTYGIAQKLGVYTNSVRVFAERQGYVFDQERGVWLRTEADRV